MRRARHEQGVGALAHHRLKGCVDLIGSAGFDDLNLQSERRAGSRLRVRRRGFCNCRVARRVSARMGEACDQA
jgi:hypothetical protein